MNVIVAIVHLAFLAILFYGIWKKEKTHLRRFFWPALLLKLAAGVCLGLLYKYYYTAGDTFNYFEDSVKIAELARTHFQQYLHFLWYGNHSVNILPELQYYQPRALFLSKITSIFCLVTLDNYWIISIYFSTITFLSSWLVVKKIASLHAVAEKAAVLGFLFFPSVVFWSSGLIKESMAMACLFFLTYIFLKLWLKEKCHIMVWLVTLLCLWILWSLKYYYLAVYLPVVSTALLVKYLVSQFGIESTPFKVMLWCVVFFIPLFMVSRLHPNFYPETFMKVIVSNHDVFQAISDPEDMIYYDSLQSTPQSLVKNAPLALISGLFRPFITEAQNPLQFVLAIENLLLLMLFVSAFLQAKKIIHTHYRMILFSIVVYSVLLGIFLALSTPNFGTLSRYRVGFMPFFVCLLTIESPLINKLMTSKVVKYLVR